MVGSLILGGVGTIGAAILTIQEGEEIAEIHGKVTALSTKLAEGFKIGASGGLPPSDSQAMPGYSQGVQNFNAAKAKLKELNPTADDNAIRSAIIAQVNAAASQAQSQILAQAQNTLWDDYASKHVDTWYHSYERERWEAWSNIFGDDPRGDSRYMRYRNDHTPGRLGC